MKRALRVAAQVLTWVGERPQGRVHSVFAKACNLAWGDWLISLVRPDLGMVPGGVAVAFTGDEDWGFLPGEAVCWDPAGGRLVGRRTAVDLSGAAVWMNQGPITEPVAVDRIAQRFAAMSRQVRTEGRGELVQVMVTDPPSFPAAGDPLCWSSHAWGPMTALLSALGAGDGEGLQRPLGALIGLGEGLTPSGDDFVTGLLALLHYGRRLLGEPQAEAGCRLAAEAERLAVTTTPVSANYLRLAAAGGFSERLEAAALALLAPGGSDAADAACRLMQIGHGSGTDALVGLLLGTSTLLLHNYGWRRSL